ncbi:MAG: imidazole glycerol phosphate synthase subunit HisH [Bacteroidota bacterium]
MKKIPTVGIVQYGAGNQASIINALGSLNVKSIPVTTPIEFGKVDKLIIPGVGHAMKAMNELKRSELEDAIRKTDMPLLGICLGMQLLGKKSEEGNAKCLSVCDFETVRFSISLKVPQMGWNKVKLTGNELFYGLEKEEWFYFVHSYYVPKSSFTIATCNYGVEFTAAVQHKNFWGVQFHPEKSGEKGLQLLKNFIELC